MTEHDARMGGEAEDRRGLLKRRGILAVAGAVMAGLIAKQTEQSVSAGIDGDVVLGSNVAQPTTGMTWINAAVSGVPAFRAVANFSGPDNHADGSQGYAVGANNAGVFGRNNDLNGVGIWGEAPNGTGAFGDSSSGSGVAGSSVSAAGLFGTSTSSSGVQGTSSSGNGVFGQSATGYGVIGYSTGGSASLSGISTNANIPAFAGGNAVAGGLAASFSGTVFVNGSFVVNDPTQKHGAIKGSDNKYRLLYSMESPEPWMEDFGTGQLVNGAAEINLDPVFADVSHTDDYHVFITEQDGTHHHLSVTSRTGQSFKVGADIEGAALKGKKASDLNGTFSWRLVAKPKSSNSATRFAPFNIPNVKLPDPATLPKQVVPKRRG